MMIDKECFWMLERYLVITLLRHEDCITSNCLEWYNLSNFLREVHLCCKAITSLSVSLLYLIQRVQRGFVRSLFQPHPPLDSARPMGKKWESVLWLSCLFYHLSVQWRERIYNLIWKSKTVKRQGFDRAVVITSAYWGKTRSVCIPDRGFQLCLFETNRLKSIKIHFLLSTVLVSL